MSLLGLAHFASVSEAIREIVRHLLFIHVWFPESYGSINGVFWSLGVEVQFYAIFPFVAWCALRRPVATFATLALVANAYRFGVRDAYDVGHLMNQLPGTLESLWSGHALRVRFLGTYGTSAATRATTHPLDVRIARRFGTCGRRHGRRLRRAAGTEWPYHWLATGRPLLTLALPLATVGALFAWPAWQRVLANPALVFLSLISYNLYLWHAAVVRALFDAHVPAWHGIDPHGDAGWAVGFTGVAFVATIGLATLLTYTLERPLLRARPFAPRGDRAIPPSLAMPLKARRS